MQTEQQGQIITFYSYKGGTGRSMALANVACLLAQEKQGDVLMIDWDLEAPGLDEYFEPYCEAELEENEGLIEFITQAIESLRPMKGRKGEDGQTGTFV